MSFANQPLKPEQRKVLRALVLEIRHLLEGEWRAGRWIPGDLELRLRAIGVREDGSVIPADELPYLAEPDRAARAVARAWLTLRKDAGASGEQAVTELVRETAWTWANRLLALRCMEASGVLEDEFILTKDAYAGRSQRHNRLIRKQPALEAQDDGGLFTLLGEAFAELAEHLSRAFDPHAPGVALRPSVTALTAILGLLSGTQRARGQEAATNDLFAAPDTLGWAYQHWNTEEKQRVFDQAAGKGPDRKRHKIEGADIVPATQLYTEPYMVRFLVQNSLGALWLSMHPDSPLSAGWEYLVRDVERAYVPPRPLREITFLDPACGSGHFLLEAFDLYFAMYREENPTRGAADIAGDILTRNLHGLDIDPRAVQIAEVALWMKAASVVVHEQGGFPNSVPANLAATDVHLPRSGDHLARFLEKHPEDAPLKDALQTVLDGLEHADELGALLLLDEPVNRALRRIQEDEEARGVALRRDAQMSLLGSADQSRLPRTARSWEDWRADVLGRLRDHFAQEAKSADLVQAFFGRAVEQGLELFDILSQRYDVVAANPPYMGSKNMGEVVREHVEEHFTAGKRDLYAAFILRCKGLLAEGGRAAIVAPQAWLFMRSFAGMRALPIDDQHGAYTGLFAETRIEVLAQLGRHAFSEADPPGNVAMFVLHGLLPAVGHRPFCIRLALPLPAEEQARLLGLAVRGDLSGLTWTPEQCAFLLIPQAPFCYWLRPRVLGLFSGRTVADIGGAYQGLATADDGRFLRFNWEAKASGVRWLPFYKGGGYRKWDGLVNLVVDWEQDGVRLTAFPRSVVRNRFVYFRSGWTYSRMARGRMGVRIQQPPGVIADKGPGIYLRDNSVLPALNSRMFSHMLRAVSPNMAFEVDVVSRGPIPDSPPNVALDAIITLKSHLTATDLTERAFTGVADLPTLLATCAELHTLEGESERAVMAAYGLDSDDIAAVVADTGTPAGWLSDQVSDATRDRIRALFEAGPGGSADAEDADADVDEEDTDDAPDLATGRPIQPETFLEEICERAGVSPRAAWAVLQQGLSEGWRCASEEARIAADRVTELILRLLGHQWHLEVERGDPAPAWADADGVVPLTHIPHEHKLIERLSERLTAMGLSEAALSAALDFPLERWVHERFAAHHTRQFKRRPAVWQLQLSTFTGRKEPAFAALLYCQRVSTQTLASLRSQYIGPLLERRRQDLRTLEFATKRSDTQEQQLRDLRPVVAELERFAEKLVDVERQGFATPGLRAIVVADAIMSLTGPVLGRWRDELKRGPLGEWALDAHNVDPSVGLALQEAVLALPLDRARWWEQVRAPEWGPKEKDLAPPPEAVRGAVVAGLEGIAHAAVGALSGAVERSFKKWMAEQRAIALAQRKSAPKFKVEKDLIEALTRRIRSWRPAPEGLADFVDSLPLLDVWCAEPGREPPATLDDLVRQESAWHPDVNDGVRVNIAPLQRAGLLAVDALAGKDLLPAIADRAIWRADERRWVREGRLPQPGWWPKGEE